MKSYKRWRDVRHLGKGMTPARLAQIDRAVEEEIIEMDLRAIRELLGKKQEEVAAVLKSSQAEVSRTEHREDHRVSTLRRYVEALGGELQLVATFGDRQVRLRAAG